MVLDMLSIICHYVIDARIIIIFLSMVWSTVNFKSPNGKSFRIVEQNGTIWFVRCTKSAPIYPGKSGTNRTNRMTQPYLISLSFSYRIIKHYSASLVLANEAIYFRLSVRVRFPKTIAWKWGENGPIERQFIIVWAGRGWQKKATPSLAVRVLFRSMSCVCSGMISGVAATLGLFIFHLLRPEYVKSLFYDVMDVGKLNLDKTVLIARPIENLNLHENW